MSYRTLINTEMVTQIQTVNSFESIIGQITRGIFLSEITHLNKWNIQFFFPNPEESESLGYPESLGYTDSEERRLILRHFSSIP